MGTFGERDLSDLALLTLGPTLQGGRNNVIGTRAAQAVFASVRALVEDQISHESEKRFEFTTSSGRRVVVVAASDPDLRLDEIVDGNEAPIVAIEIKGGGDASNAHNRAGEAEKSQIKARGLGFNQRWTVINMGTIPPNQIRAETPTSTELFEARDVINRSGPDWDRFKRLLASLLGEAGNSGDR